MADVTGIMVNSGTMMKAKLCGHSWGLSPNMGSSKKRETAVDGQIGPIAAFVYPRHDAGQNRHAGKGAGRFRRPAGRKLSCSRQGEGIMSRWCLAPGATERERLYENHDRRVSRSLLPCLRSLSQLSIEITPKQVDKIALLQERLAPATRVYVALIDPADIDKQIEAVAAMRSAGLEPVPHVPARFVSEPRRSRPPPRAPSRSRARSARCSSWAAARRSRSAIYDAAIQLLETGLFQANGITRIGMAGHPEGNPDIVKAHGEPMLMTALKAKQAYLAANGLEGYHRHPVPVRGGTGRLLGQDAARRRHHLAHSCRRAGAGDDQDAGQIRDHVRRRQFGPLHPQAGAQCHQAADRVDPRCLCRETWRSCMSSGRSSASPARIFIPLAASTSFSTGSCPGCAEHPPNSRLQAPFGAPFLFSKLRSNI